ncbi:hypothetical protein O181_015397 [Austropuccinia psidii MF-1]|uniref:Uncharacterized protein n=1 Tax=Austropuccinia psidii MF-1 TaxID=1389203 RepID=A0A9Q3C3L6_9BASI|nr:hypothetical protein [Austropuccinia psidii MF-1]
MLKRVPNGQKPSFKANFKDNGNKPPSWMMPIAKKGEYHPRGTIAQSIRGIYFHITIIILGYNPRVMSLRELLIEVQKKSIIQRLKNLLEIQRREEDRQSKTMKKVENFQDNGHNEKKNQRKPLEKMRGFCDATQQWQGIIVFGSPPVSRGGYCNNH